MKKNVLLIDFKECCDKEMLIGVKDGMAFYICIACGKEIHVTSYDASFSEVSDEEAK